MQTNSDPAGGTVWLVPNTLDLGADTDTPVDTAVPTGTLHRAAALRTNSTDTDLIVTDISPQPIVIPSLFGNATTRVGTGPRRP